MSNRSPSHRPAKVPSHNRDTAAELDLSEAMIRLLWHLYGVKGDDAPARTYAALERRGYIDLAGKFPAFTEEGVKVCERLFPKAVQ